MVVSTVPRGQSPLPAPPARCITCPQQPFLAGYTRVEGGPAISYGLRRLDHAVGNVHVLSEAATYIMGFTGSRRRSCVVVLCAYCSQKEYFYHSVGLEELAPHCAVHLSRGVVWCGVVCTTSNP
jgi:hypothetical protein